MSEIGHASPVGIGMGFEDSNWELRWPRSQRVYREMKATDAQVKSVFKAVTLPIQRTTWRVDPNSADPRFVRLVSEDLRLDVLGAEAEKRVDGPHRVSWTQHLKWAVQHLIYGAMFFELVVDDDNRLRKIAPRLPTTLARVEVENDGGLSAIVQVPPPGSKDPTGPKIPVDRLLAYVNEPDDFSWHGESMLRAAYKHWMLKNEFLRMEARVIERNGMGVPIYTQGNPQNPDEINDGKRMAMGLRGGKDAGAAIPAGAKLEIAGTKGQIQTPREAILYHDSQIGRSALAHFLNLEGKGGSYALAEVQADIFMQQVQTIADEIADTASQHLVEKMVRWHFGDDVQGPFPKIMCDPVGTNPVLTAEALALLVDKGVLWMDPALEADVRRKYQLPAKQTDGGI